MCVAMACTVFSMYCLCTQSISSVMHTIVISPSIPLERMHYLLAFEPSLSSFYTWLSTPTCLWSCIMRIAPSNHVLVTTMAPSVHSTRYFIHSYHGCLRPVLYYFFIIFALHCAHCYHHCAGVQDWCSLVGRIRTHYLQTVFKVL